MNIGVLATCVDGSVVSVVPCPIEVEKTAAFAVATNWSFLPTFDPRRSVFSPRALTQYVGSTYSITSNSNSMSASCGSTASSSGAGSGVYERLLLSSNQLPRVQELDAPATLQVASEVFGWYLRACPGAMFLLCNGEDHPPIHAPDYDFPDFLLEEACRMFQALI